MLKKILTTVYALTILLSALAQDTIVKTDGTKVIAKVTEINSNTIKYRVANGSGEYIYESKKNSINFIAYHNGNKEFYNTAVHPKLIEDIVVVEQKKDYGKNSIAVNIFEMFFANFSASYERVLKSGKYSVKVPISFGLGGKPMERDYGTEAPSTDFLQNKIYGTGLELNFYPLGQTHTTFYVGLSGAYGSFNYYKDSIGTSYQYGYGQNIVMAKNKYVGSHYSGMVYIGGYLGVSENILIGAKFAFGYKREETLFTDYTQLKAQLDINFAYRF